MEDPVEQPERTPDRRSSGTGWWVATFVISMAALIAAVIAVVAAKSDSTSAGGTAASTSGGTTEFDIVLADLTITPAQIEVPAGQVITLHVTNNGPSAHDYKVDGTTGTAMLKAGESETIEVGPFTQNTQAWCTVPGHKEAGMLMMIMVTGATAGGGQDSGTTGTVPTSNDATLDPAAAPSADWTPRDPQLPPAESATVHEIAFDATEVEMEVAPGVTQMMWTFNNQVPGPTLRGNIGDTFRITLTNKGSMGHSIDFHASKVAWSDEMRTIQPGESLVYEFTATNAGAFMYHCGTAPTLHHIGNGMYGAIIIDPPGLKPVEQEFLVVQSEMYFGPQGQPGDLTKMQNEDWDAVVFNGYVAQYKHAPIHVDANKTYRMWVVDDGPNENSAFHIVGTIFDSVFKEGAFTLQPDATKGGSQVLDLQPAQGGFVEFSFAEDGLYPFVTHKFANPGKGALGFFAVGNADTSALGNH